MCVFVLRRVNVFEGESAGAGVQERGFESVQGEVGVEHSGSVAWGVLMIN